MPPRTIRVLAALLAFCPAVPAQAGEGGFVPGIGDLLLMAGLALDQRQALKFDNPEGRIVEAVAVGPIEAESVRSFYAQTLPQLGWRAAGPDRWARDGEALALEFPAPTPAAARSAAAECCRLTVRFRLNPL
ncbi:hypothetical protein [Arenibaculum pallidiluteum]|uniref:hypothetical protein n=1 Tax=Arenibaculum pallidiluteum TaxID=2812559 RepID=UPI001A970582|nr:hypothetical protein [Arenibaculum pallidiluteum]